MQLYKIKILYTCCTRVVRVALVSHSCRQCSTRVALVSHTCRSCLTHVALVLLVSHLCCIRVTRVTLVSLVSGTRVVNQSRWNRISPQNREQHSIELAHRIGNDYTVKILAIRFLQSPGLQPSSSGTRPPFSVNAHNISEFLKLNTG